MYLYPSGRNNYGVFGLNTLLIGEKFNNKNCVCITEGEFDAMSVYQVTKIPTISLPYGANSLPLYIVKWIENFDLV